MALIYPVDPSVALVVGLDRIKIEMTNWGNVGPTQDPNNGSVIQELRGTSYCGMCIAPESLVDEVMLQSGEERSGIGGQARGFQWKLSPGSPFVGELPSVIRVVATTVQADKYYALSGAVGPFNEVSFKRLQQPTLSLVGWLRADTVVPTQRVRMGASTNSRSGGFVTVPANPGLLELVTWPVSGRKKCRVSFKVKGPGGSAVELYVTAVPVAFENPLIMSPKYGMEQLLAGPVTVPADSQHTFVIDPLYVSLLMPKAKYLAGTPSVWVEMEAVD